MIEKRIKDLAKTRPHMSCIFQVCVEKYQCFSIYATYTLCYEIDYMVMYKTTQLKEDIIKLKNTDDDLNTVINDAGYNSNNNTIFSFYIE